MYKNALLDNLKDILTPRIGFEDKAARIAEEIRNAGSWRWVGLYKVKSQSGVVTNIAWSGPSGPAYSSFPVTKGLTSRAIAGRKTVNVPDVTHDSDYLTCLGSTRSEIIIPILSDLGDKVIGTIDIESENLNAFDAEAQNLLEEWASALKRFWGK